MYMHKQALLLSLSLSLSLSHLQQLLVFQTHLQQTLSLHLKTPHSPQHQFDKSKGKRDTKREREKRETEK